MNSFDPIDPALVDCFMADHDGYPAELAKEDTPDVLRDACGSASREFPRALWIEKKDRADKCRENDKYKTWPINYVDRFTNQSPTHECTTHSARTSFEACRNRQRGVIFPDGPKKGFRYPESAEFNSVWMSVMSVYARANPGQWGGANCRQVLEIVVKYGFLPDLIQPKEYGFKHKLQGTAGTGGINQSKGPWTKVQGFPDGYQATADLFKAQEVIFTSNWEEVICLVLHGYAVGVGRNGHAIPYSFWSEENQTMGYVDSYDVVRYDSLGTVKSAAGGAYAIASVTTPDDWLKPAG